MTYRFAICDDQPAQRELLTQLAQKWARLRRDAAEASSFPSAEAFLFSYADAPAFDILLLDIEMERMNGVQLARTVRAGNREVQIVFVTGFMEYIADGYDVEALHYLLKPVDEAKLFAVLDRAAEKLKRNGRALIIESGGESVRVPLYEIRALEAQRNYVTVHAARDYSVKSPLGELEAELDDSFFRVGRSFIVNLRYIRRVSRTDVYLSDGSVIPLPRGQYDRIHQAMIERL